MARHRLVRHRASLVLLLIGLLLSSSSTAARAIETTRTTARATTESYSYPRSRKLLVTAPRVSPDTRPSGSQQEMDVGGWRRATPFRRAGASLGRRVPGSHANPSHN
ncbi:hypothetical protein GQ55_1G226900 [Panicum hallii var. hallii]|uniref:Uncharacterized protein n=2 Tax=Panicum sect. Panicum TaxID=2100772 RepID=A0A3L6QLL3_PANMI|nr:hypothetical protein GQ55_1G226900 [Panicum hallii var. hallii]RLM80692.1 hypothetical protein C2845_PM12G14660 [Panicum miliaceum]